MSVEGRAVFAQVCLVGEKGFMGQAGLGELSPHPQPGEPAGNTLAVPHSPRGCKGLSRVHQCCLQAVTDVLLLADQSQGFDLMSFIPSEFPKS